MRTLLLSPGPLTTTGATGPVALNRVLANRVLATGPATGARVVGLCAADPSIPDAA